MNEFLFVLATLLVTVVATIRKGRTWAFAYLYIPFTLLVPWNLFLHVQGLPELTPHRAIVSGILIGSVLSGRIRDLVPAWRKIDFWVLGIVLSFSLSFGLSTDLKGFFHRLVTQTMDWGLPYLYARTVFRDVGALRYCMPPLAISAALLGFFSLYEARMIDRVMARFWNVAAGYPIPDHWLNGGGFRWGYLRAFGPFGNPLILASVLVALAPLTLCWSWLDHRRRMWGRLAALFVAVGVLGPISRGPMLALGGITTVFTLAAARLPALFLTAFGGFIAYAAFSDAVTDVVDKTETDLAFEGNTESGKYRVALLMIYLEEIPKVGFFGDLTVIGAKYEGAWSIDNSFLFMYIMGGWMGGTLFLLLVFVTCIGAYRALVRSAGLERKLRAGITASFVGMAVCIANVWFTPEFAGFFFMLVALVWNQNSPGWYASLPRKKAVARARRPGPAHAVPAASTSLAPPSWQRPPR